VYKPAVEHCLDIDKGCNLDFCSEYIECLVERTVLGANYYFALKLCLWGLKLMHHYLNLKGKNYHSNFIVDL
jgi:hypothetical protein